MEELLQSIAESPEQTIVTTLIVIVGVIILMKLGADQLAQDLVSIFGIFLLAGTVGTLFLLVKLIQKPSGAGQKARA